MSWFLIAALVAAVPVLAYYLYRAMAPNPSQASSNAAPRAESTGDLPRGTTRRLDEPVAGSPRSLGGPATRATTVEPEDDNGAHELTIPAALDRIAAEVRELVAERDTLVVWLFDRSLSNQELRNQVVERLELLTREMAMSRARPAGSGKSPQLLTSIGAYSQETVFLTDQPTADFGQLADALTKIEADNSGVENTFAAVGQAVDRFADHRRGGGYLVVVLVSDEVGDDQDQIEPLVDRLQQLSVPVYAIGATAPFGRRLGAFFHAEGTDPPRVIQGPESLFPECVQLGFPDMAPLVAASEDDLTEWAGLDLDNLDSGIGPYSLVRLCRESGGQFFAIPNGGLSFGFGAEPPFNPDVMRRYEPTYKGEKDYRELLASNAACRALHEAAKLDRIDTRLNLVIEFAAGDEARLKELLALAQRPPARLMPKLEQLHETIKRGAADRDQIEEPRWRAGFDLAFGRATAARVRNESYIALLASLKQGKLFSDPSHSVWVLQTTDEIEISSALDSMRKQAQESLRRVVDEHPGTPWAAIAQRELATPMGWNWTER